MWWLFKKKKKGANEAASVVEPPPEPVVEPPPEPPPEPVVEPPPEPPPEPVVDSFVTELVIPTEPSEALMASVLDSHAPLESSDDDLVDGMTAVDILLGVEINAKYPDMVSETEVRTVIGLVRDGGDHQARAIDVLTRLVETSKSIRMMMAKSSVYTHMDDTMLPMLTSTTADVPDAVKVSICDVYTNLYAYCILGSRMDVREIRDVYMAILRNSVEKKPEPTTCATISRCLLGIERLTTTSHQAQDLVDEGAVQLMCEVLARHGKIPAVCHAAVAMLEILTTTRHGQLAMMKHESRALANLLLAHHQVAPDARIINLLYGLDNEDCAEALASSDRSMEMLARELATSHDKSLTDALLCIMETVCEQHGAKVRTYLNLNLNVLWLYKHPLIELPTKIRVEYVLHLLGLDPESS
jgi:hypothetical protein